MYLSVASKTSYGILFLLVLFATVTALRDVGVNDDTSAYESSLVVPPATIAPEHSVRLSDIPLSGPDADLRDVQRIDRPVSNDQKSYGPDSIVNIGADVDVDDTYYGEDDFFQPIDIGANIDVDDYSEPYQSDTEVVNIGDDIDVESINTAYDPSEPIDIGPDVDVPESGQALYDSSDVVIDLGDDIFVEDGI